MIERITIDPNVCHGKPCVRGLRYPVEVVLQWLAAGMTPQGIIDDYPDLELADIHAVLAFAARLSRIRHIEPLAA
ncbi:MAG: DUF433 domain-containing protein [Betaproteobacteria bacterium]|nr:DUF433 domain-containing protein [Betaproteobacteria bacterium]